jgi:cell division protein FtsN
MPRDYAKSAPKKRKPATRSNSRKTVAKTNSRWPGILSGFVIGMLVMYVYQTWDSRQEDIVKVFEDLAGDRQSTPQKPSFEFYDMLQYSEVKVPDVEPEPLRGSVQADQNVYMLQAGSFRSAEDADSLRAQLLLLNLDARVEKTSNQQAGVWYRVIIGPFTSRSKLTGARATLFQNRIDNLVLKRKNNS